MFIDPKKKFVLGIQLIIALLALEFFSYLASTNKLLLFNEPPNLLPPLNYEFPQRTERHPWGAWRDPFSHSHHRSSCFDVEVITNEFGARDEPFDRSGEYSIILIGDSFAEGFGVSHADSAATHLEARLGRKIHNLGSAGNFGPLQQYILYQAMAGDIKHSELIIFFLPLNDFTDNDRKYWSGSSLMRSRYRPYFGDDNALVPYYFPSAKPGVEVVNPKQEHSVLSIVKQTLIQYTWSANTLRTLKNLWNPSEPLVSNQPKTFYLAATALQQENVVESYEALAKEAGDRQISVVIIPAIEDIRYFRSIENNRSYKSQHWYQGLARIAENSGGTLLDLIDFIPNEWRHLFFSCDGHWSPAGNMWAANVIHEQVFQRDSDSSYEK